MSLPKVCLPITLLCWAALPGAEPEGPAPRTSPGKPGPQPAPSAVVEVTAPLPREPLVTVTDPKAPRQPLPAHDGADYLKTIPGFSVIRKGGTDGDPVLRGMAGSRLAMLLDGELLLGGCGMRMDPPTAYIFPESYDRITVVKGPETVLYGPGNSAGVVAFDRNNARLKQTGVQGTASAMGGSFGRTDEVLDVRGGTPDFYVRAIGTHAKANDYADGSGNSVHSHYSRWSANGAIGWTPDDDTRLELSTTRSNGEAAYADRTMDGARFFRDNLGFKATFRKLTKVMEKVEVQVYRNYVDHIMDNYSERTFIPTMMAAQPSAMNPDRTTKGGRVAVDWRLAPGTLLVTGVDGQANVHTGRMSMMQWSLPEENLPRVADARFRNLGLFAEATQTFTTGDRLVAGLRTDRWHGEDPRATVAVTMMTSVPNPTAEKRRDDTLGSGFLRYEYQLAPESTLYAGFGHAERSPDYWEAITKESLTTVSAFDTRAERTNQLDLGWVKSGGTVRTSLSVFYGRVADFILIQSNVSKPAMMAPRVTTIARNVDATTWGGEMALETRVAGFLKVDASLAYTRGANNTDGTPLAQIPPLEARLVLGYEHAAWSTGMLLRGVARQSRFAINEGNIVGQDLGPTPGFATLAVNGGWRPAQGWLVTAGVDNLFNRTFAEHISRNTNTIPGYLVQSIRVNEPGRNPWLKASLTFGR